MVDIQPFCVCHPGLLHQSHEDEILSERAFLEANKLFDAKEVNKQKEVVKHRMDIIERKQDDKQEVPPSEPHNNQQQGGVIFNEPTLKV